jgi:hypothetical protein
MSAAPALPAIIAGVSGSPLIVILLAFGTGFLLPPLGLFNFVALSAFPRDSLALQEVNVTQQTSVDFFSFHPFDMYTSSHRRIKTSFRDYCFYMMFLLFRV